jgi:hypothetical protein
MRKLAPAYGTKVIVSSCSALSTANVVGEHQRTSFRGNRLVEASDDTGLRGKGDLHKVPVPIPVLPLRSHLLSLRFPVDRSRGSLMNDLKDRSCVTPRVIPANPAGRP